MSIIFCVPAYSWVFFASWWMMWYFLPICGPMVGILAFSSENVKISTPWPPPSSGLTSTNTEVSDWIYRGKDELLQDFPMGWQVVVKSPRAIGGKEVQPQLIADSYSSEWIVLYPTLRAHTSLSLFICLFICFLFFLCLLLSYIFWTSEYMKHHIFELGRKIWRHNNHCSYAHNLSSCEIKAWKN